MQYSKAPSSISVTLLGRRRAVIAVFANALNPILCTHSPKSSAARFSQELNASESIAVTTFPSIVSGITTSVTVSSQPVIKIVSSSITRYITLPPIASNVPVVSSSAKTFAGRMPINRHMDKSIATNLLFFNFIQKPPILLFSAFIHERLSHSFQRSSHICS